MTVNTCYRGIHVVYWIIYTTNSYQKLIESTKTNECAGHMCLIDTHALKMNLKQNAPKFSPVRLPTGESHYRPCGWVRFCAQ